MRPLRFPSALAGLVDGWSLTRDWSRAQTRQKLKEAFDAEFLATIERAEKQLILAKHGRRLLALLDDTPLVPGDDRAPYEHGSQARQVLNDAEDDLRDWRPEAEGLETPVGRGSPEGSLKGKGSAGNGNGRAMSPCTAGNGTMSEGEGEGNGFHFHDDRSSQADA